MGSTGILAALILTPFAALAIPVLKIRAVRNGLIGLIVFVLCATSLALAIHGPFTARVDSILGMPLAPCAAFIDFALLAAFAYIGIQRRQPLALALVLGQAAPLVYLELFRKVELASPISFSVDWLAILMTLLVGWVGSTIVLFSIPYMDDHEKHLGEGKSRQGRFFAIFLVFLGAMNGLFLSDNLFMVYLFWEMTTLCCVLLIGHDQTQAARASANRALWMNLLGGLAFAMAILFITTGGHGLSTRELVQNHPGHAAIMMPMALLCIAGFSKAAQVPFQGWLLGAMVAPTPVSALLHSSTMVKAGVYLILRFAPVYQNTTLSTLVMMVGGLSFVGAAMLAISQSDAKRVLAYSTISNLGLIIVCAGLNTPLSVSVGVTLILFHAVSKALLFMTTGVIQTRIHSREIEDMRSLIAYMPFTTSVAVLGILSMFVPPFGMIVAKWAALEAASTQPIIMIMIVLGSTFTLVFWTKWIGRMLGAKPTPERPKMEPLHPLYRGPLSLLVAMVLGLSFLVTVVVDRAVGPAVQRFYSEGGTFVGVGFGLESSLGLFPIIIVTGVIAVAVIIPAIFLKGRPGDPNSVYMCGEQAPEEDHLSFVAASDEPIEMSVGFLYFDRMFGESRHVGWLNAVATCLLALVVVSGFAI